MAPWTMVYGTEKPEQHPTMLLFGVVQPGYSYIQANSGNVPDATVKGNAEFKFYRVRPGVRGSIGPNIDYYFLAEFANNPADPNNGIIGHAHVLDASVTLNYIPGVHVQIGQMLVPFAEEGLTAAPVLPWINYSPITYNIDYNEFASTPAYNGIAGPGSGLFNAGGELGIMAFNGISHGPLSFNYAVGLFNGTGVSELQSSMGHPDDALVHLGADYGPLGVALGYENGRQVIGPYVAGGIDRTPMAIPGMSYQQQKYAIDLRYGNYMTDPLWLWYEYQHAKNTQQPGVAGSGTARGWFAAAGVRPLTDVMAVFRYSTYNTENMEPVAVSTAGPVLAPHYAGAAGVTTSLDQESLIGVYLANRGVRYYLEWDRTSYNNSGAPTDNAVSVMVSLPFGARLIH
ncbi:MAG: porin [Gammaproteobacteria bacterium]|nr:porin [Gammaproteobacteria bacterium]